MVWRDDWAGGGASLTSVASQTGFDRLGERDRRLVDVLTASTQAIKGAVGAPGVKKCIGTRGRRKGIRSWVFAAIRACNFNGGC